MSDDLKVAAEWLASTGYPCEWSHRAGHLPPRPLWDALVDYVHADADGKWHGGYLDREGVHYWLLDECGHFEYPEQPPT